MKKILYAAIVLAGLSSTASAQVMPQFNMYGQNAMLINPAYTGIENFTDLKLSGRFQWAGAEGAPSTGVASFNIPIMGKGGKKGYSLQVSDTALVQELMGNIKPKVHFGVGGYVLYDKIGAFNRVTVNISYGFHIPLGKKVMAAIAPSLGVSTMGFDPSKVTLLEPNDPLYQQYLGNGGRATYMDFGMGAVVYGKNWTIGYSALQLLQNRVSFGDDPTDARLNIQHQIMGSYNFRINPKWEMIQSALLKIPYPQPIGFDLNLRFRYNGMLWFGAGFRYDNAVMALVGVRVAKRVSINYSFDIPYNNTRLANGGSHEFTLGFNIGKNKNAANYLW